MSISADDYRDVLRHFPAGVTLVTSCRGDLRHGMTVSAFTSLSAEPPLIAVALDRRNSIHPLLEGPGACFGVSILTAEQQDLSDRFAFVKDEDRFAMGQWRTAATGAPVLADAAAWLDCRVEREVEVGSHILYVGAVQQCEVPRPEAAPLLYWNRAYRVLNGTE